MAVIRVGGDIEKMTIDEGPARDSRWRRVRYEREPDGSVTAMIDHVIRDDDEGEVVVETFRPARWSPEKLIDIKVDDV